MTEKLERAAMRRRMQQLIQDAREAGLIGELAGLWRELGLTSGELEDVAAIDGALAKPATNGKVDVASGAAEAASSTLDVASEMLNAAAIDAHAVPRRFGMVGDSPPMRALFDLIAKVAVSDVSVLIQGETGTGKELVARALHEHGRRRDKPFLAENCAAVPANLLESELFGHKRGSFTGAIADRAGHFVAADGGTVFLDEIGDMPFAMQAKLLRVLQEGEVRPVGSNKSLKVDVRIVAASNKDLPSMCRAGTFREDLYYRLNVVTLMLPPLRMRNGDVRHLARFFLAAIEPEVGRELAISEAGLVALEHWRWPGNVRELENVIRRAAVFSKGSIGPAELALPTA